MLGVIILAAGEGSRLRPSIGNTPKSLFPIEGRSLLERNLANLRDVFGDTKVRLALGFEAGRFGHLGVESRINSNWARTGQIGTLAIYDDLLSADYQIVLYGDCYFDKSNLELARERKFEPWVSSLVTWKQNWQQRYARIEDDLEGFVQRDGRLISLGERNPDIGKVGGQFAGAFMISPEIWLQMKSSDLIQPRMAATDFLSAALSAGHTFSVCEFSDPWAELDTPADLDYATSIFAG